ncbi:MAG: undecaprenyl-diphosphate phosphatase [Alphaproteobacteria bacterium]|nr:undecaprenyl-diphosphate phosphatase [Alphaproteobacteria bacterium]
MPLLHIAVVAIVQGLTEFLPISSSGHLILAWQVLEHGTGRPVPPEAQQLVMDIAVHVGTLGAVTAYLWREVWLILRGLGLAVRGRPSPGLRLLGLLVLATIPVIIAGFLLDQFVGTALRSVEVIAWAFIGFGLLLYVVDRVSLTVKRMEHIGLGSALFVGLAQALALIPGTSRAGITMTAARALGYERVDAARFSMLLSIPTIIAAGALAGYKIYKTDNISLGFDALLGGVLAFVVALLAILAMMSWLRRASFTPFVIYRVIFGVFLLAVVYGVFKDALPWLVLQ